MASRPHKFIFLGIASLVAVLLLFGSSKVDNNVDGDNLIENKFATEEHDERLLEERKPVDEAFRKYLDCYRADYNRRKADGNVVDMLWSDALMNITRGCMANSELSKIKLVPITNKDEVKYHIYSESQEPSVIVTLGVGADTTVEEELKRRSPKGSEFFAADPIYVPNAHLFATLGTFFPLAVGSEIGISEASIRRDKGNYETVTIPHIDFFTFIRKFLNKNVLDHLLMDNEGPEFDLLPMFAKGGVLDEHDITICQMNVEVHLFQHKLKLFPAIMDTILHDGRFVPLHVVHSGHQRMYFFNAESTYCIAKYISPFFKPKTETIKAK